MLDTLASAPVHTPDPQPSATGDGAPATDPGSGRDWLTGEGMAYPILDTLRDAGWVRHEDPLANVYTASPDDRAHVAFLPEHPAGWPAPLWEVSVDLRNGGWRQEFHASVPCELVHAFVRTLLTEHRSIHE